MTINNAKNKSNRNTVRFSSGAHVPENHNHNHTLCLGTKRSAWESEEHCCSRGLPKQHNRDQLVAQRLPPSRPSRDRKFLNEHPGVAWTGNGNGNGNGRQQQTRATVVPHRTKYKSILKQNSHYNIQAAAPAQPQIRIHPESRIISETTSSNDEMSTSTSTSETAVAAEKNIVVSSLTRSHRDSVRDLPQLANRLQISSETTTTTSNDEMSTSTSTSETAVVVVEKNIVVSSLTRCHRDSVRDLPQLANRLKMKRMLNLNLNLPTTTTTTATTTIPSIRLDRWL